MPTNVRIPPFAVSLLTHAFSIAPFAEDWEYEDDEAFGAENEGVPTAGGETRSKTVGILEKRANMTVVGREAVISKGGKGGVKVHVLIWIFSCLLPFPMSRPSLTCSSRTCNEPTTLLHLWATIELSEDTAEARLLRSRRRVKEPNSILPALKNVLTFDTVGTRDVGYECGETQHEMQSMDCTWIGADDAGFEGI